MAKEQGTQASKYEDININLYILSRTKEGKEPVQCTRNEVAFKTKSGLLKISTSCTRALTPCENNNDCQHLVNSTCEKDGFCICEGSRFCNKRILRNYLTKIGENCTEDMECNIENAECSTDKKCACKPNYVNSTNEEKCLRNGIGDNCEDNIQCFTQITNSVCQQNTCVCQHDTHVYEGSCYKTVDFGEICERDEECSLTNFTKCKESRCACREDYVKNKIGSDCISDVQCTRSLGGGAACINGHCDCKEIYQYKNTTNSCFLERFVKNTAIATSPITDLVDSFITKS
ncbi:hypothetical protein NQ317_019831 [Molorchus minor]|uniref:EB domain-containing protein n=1 Tax=Molorchus minor TaxID=1323400 RepID=A0ABQ9J2V6_9CUCU|nr:hypothetical protein NQ317_019831 [Molorchus minor]